ncbi:hypothetical protein [Paenibacillus gansuensis]|uniref:Uncharacterized protein n=1 Tax=Paenibacillus gansuensis TaxID=306542 RepID=A0ABW5PI36_9BACL
MAVGSLLELGLFSSLDEAEKEVKRIRPGVQLNETQRRVLEHLYPYAKE